MLFTHFVSNPKYRTQVLQLLQGDLYDEDEPPVLTKMRELANAVEENENHIWHSMLGTLTANAFRPAF